MKPQHQAIAAGLALTLAFGTAATPSTLFANTDTDSEDALVAAEGASADGTDAGEGEASEELPAPGDFDRADAEACMMEHALSEDTMQRWMSYLEQQGITVGEE